MINVLALVTSRIGTNLRCCLALVSSSSPGQKRPREPKPTHKTKLSRKIGPLAAISGGGSNKDESDVTPVEPKQILFCDVGGAEEAIAIAKEVWTSDVCCGVQARQPTDTTCILDW